ncbi:MAG TPA: methyltransferase domain-containing protein [Clostridia bacterium]|nr:methyltransferase domain-containing protein [Clostridia bacterium]
MPLDNNITYAFDVFEKKDVELNRLFKQASAITDFELEFLQQHGLQDGIRFLDAACGPGAISCLVAQKYMNMKVVGVDINKTLLEEAEKLAKDKGLQIEFCQSDIYDLKFEGCFDFVYSRFVFQHLSEPHKALKSLYRTLRPGGRLCIADVDDSWLFLYPEVEAFQSLTRKGIERQAKAGGDRLVGRKLRNYLKDSGFTDIRVDVIPINSDQIGVKQFIDISTSFKENLVPAHENDNKGDLDELWKEVNKGDFFGMAGLFIISGLK